MEADADEKADNKEEENQKDKIQKKKDKPEVKHAEEEDRYFKNIFLIFK